ncbi:hypothetical protein N7510_001201 [Penicillium lagena]|uniref:uncharacterized protein n=1 Tax=Penicillium lagena TaxID=94218 RepID=UPI0025406BEE|nr:uncharacterized protein N7510_001201 [Penicillium lagena]KAJ5624892.1 hypothetical protein N7510_001201 [Penicillium lagena]
MAQHTYSMPKSEYPILQIPSGSTVNVSVIDNSRMRLPCSHLLTPLIPQHEMLNLPSFSFLIEHPTTKRKVLFDLGLRKDLSALPPAVQTFLSESGWDLTVTKNVTEILKEKNVLPDAIEAVALSHHHFDHLGDLSQLPKDTKIIVGPGFQEAYLPGWPINPESSLIDKDWQEHPIQEIAFSDKSTSLSIGEFQAMDYFEDGSFFLLNAPGHTIGHLAALARVTAGFHSSSKSSVEHHPNDTFVFLAGDICHYPGVFRPTQWLPLDSNAHSIINCCPQTFYHDIHPKKSHVMPFYEMPKQATVDEKAARDSIRKLYVFDWSEDVLVIIGHDTSLVGKVDFFPKTVNDWKSKANKSNLQWSFLADFGSDLISS